MTMRDTDQRYRDLRNLFLKNETQALWRAAPPPRGPSAGAPPHGDPGETPLGGRLPQALYPCWCSHSQSQNIKYDVLSERDVAHRENELSELLIRSISDTWRLQIDFQAASARAQFSLSNAILSTSIQPTTSPSTPRAMPAASMCINVVCPRKRETQLWSTACSRCGYIGNINICI